MESLIRVLCLCPILMVFIRITSGLKALVPLSRRLHYILALDTKTDCSRSTRPTLVDIIYIDPTVEFTFNHILFIVRCIKAIALPLQAFIVSAFSSGLSELTLAYHGE